MSFIIQHTTPLAQERADMPYAVQLNETEYGVVGDVGPSWVGRPFYKWFPQNGDCTNSQTYAGSIISIKRLDEIDGVDHLLDVFKVKYADGESEDMDEDEIRHLLCTSSVTDGALALVNADSWNLARYLAGIHGTMHCQALGIECAAAPTVCPCARGH